MFIWELNFLKLNVLLLNFLLVMSIPESQLSTWSNQGAQVGSQTTHKSIRRALATYTWPERMGYDVYLQGSYANYTNIRGNSDVDIIVETQSIYYDNLTQSEQEQLGWIRGDFSWSDFRGEVIKALVSYYGGKYVDTSGGKSVKVLASGNRLAADVIPCAQYKWYEDLKVVAEGVTFWDRKNNSQIVNYPKLHRKNGAAKNSYGRTRELYKPSIRIFKNARDRLVRDTPSLEGLYPSYFVECLLFNTADSCFSGDYQDVFVAILNDLLERIKNDGIDDFVTQSGRHWLFGSHSVQWNKRDALDYVYRLVDLWNDWYQ